MKVKSNASDYTRVRCEGGAFFKEKLSITEIKCHEQRSGGLAFQCGVFSAYQYCFCVTAFQWEFSPAVCLCRSSMHEKLKSLAVV